MLDLAMSPDLYDRVMQVIDNLRGSSTSIMQGFDQAIEDDTIITQKEFSTNEYEILAIVDNEIFECTTCGWTLNVDEMGEDTESGELQCDSCSSD